METAITATNESFIANVIMQQYDLTTLDGSKQLWTGPKTTRQY